MMMTRGDVVALVLLAALVWFVFHGGIDLSQINVRYGGR